MLHRSWRGKKVVKKNNLNVVDLINDIYLKNFDRKSSKKAKKKKKRKEQEKKLCNCSFALNESVNN